MTARPLALVVQSGDFDRVHYALVMASAAAATDRPAVLFFTGPALAALRRPGADGTPGWAAMPAAGAMDGRARDAQATARGVAGFEELLAACAELGVAFLVCEMGLRAEGLAMADLRDDLGLEDTGFVTFLARAGDGALVFV